VIGYHLFDGAVSAVEEACAKAEGEAADDFFFGIGEKLTVVPALGKESKPLLVWKGHSYFL